ncbi:hypothetical protein QBC42DRAFT_281490 [Cladorrhinum samala]|uniref:Uncharacterized protein n=1 Tax=Cladorrhinum samala TaxID=585594 RepID=A0AAV9H9D5_9PEZI|nr:hypothetical protein QBC42DRAFT_281490 [Cladorrhinum samala]
MFIPCLAWEVPYTSFPINPPATLVFISTLRGCCSLLPISFGGKGRQPCCFSKRRCDFDQRTLVEVLCFLFLSFFLSFLVLNSGYSQVYVSLCPKDF